MPEPLIKVSNGQRVAVEITPLASPRPLQGRMCGINGVEVTPIPTTSLITGHLRPQGRSDPTALSQEELITVESQLREAVLATSDTYLIGLNAVPAIEGPSYQLTPLPMMTGTGTDDPFSLSTLGGGGIYQLMNFPIARFDGIPLPAGSRIRFADPSRWFKGAMESRLMTITLDGTKKVFSWDAHFPVGGTQHPYYHVNQKGMAGVFGASNHSGLSGAALVQARQLRYLKIGGRVFLVVGVVIDTVQLSAAGYESYQTGSAKPIAKQAVRTASGWAAAWAGAKAGMAVGALAGVETGPGMVLTAIGGGLVGGVAGYFGGNWIADWLFD